MWVFRYFKSSASERHNYGLLLWLFRLCEGQGDIKFSAETCGISIRIIGKLPSIVNFYLRYFLEVNTLPLPINRVGKVFTPTRLPHT